jgi:hypothetical protein
MRTVLSSSIVEGPGVEVDASVVLATVLDEAPFASEPAHTVGISITALCSAFFFFPVTEDDLRFESLGFCFKSNSSFEIRNTFFDDPSEVGAPPSAVFGDGSVMVNPGIVEVGSGAGVDWAE